MTKRHRITTPEQRERKNNRERERYHSETEQEREDRRQIRRERRQQNSEVRAREREQRKEQKRKLEEQDPERFRLRNAKQNAKKRIAHEQLTPQEREDRAAAAREYGLKNKFGISLEEWQIIFDNQGQRCGICRRAEPGSVLGWSTDHHPGTRVVRGILCQRCNTRLGKCGDQALLILLQTEKNLKYLGALLEDEYLTVGVYGEVPVDLRPRMLKYLTTPEGSYKVTRVFSEGTKARMREGQLARRGREQEYLKKLGIDSFDDL